MQKKTDWTRCAADIMSWAVLALLLMSNLKVSRIQTASILNKHHGTTQDTLDSKVPLARGKVIDGEADDVKDYFSATMIAHGNRDGSNSAMERLHKKVSLVKKKTEQKTLHGLTQDRIETLPGADEINGLTVGRISNSFVPVNINYVGNLSHTTAEESKLLGEKSAVTGVLRRKRANCINNCGICGVPFQLPDRRVNVAWNKPAWQSSFYNVSNVPGISCGGLDYFVRKTAGNVNGFHTGSADDRAFWLVDLQSEYTIKDVFLSRRRPVNEYPTDAKAQRNSVITVNGLLCYEFPRDANSIENLFKVHGYSEWIRCQKPTRGRYVHIQKKASVPGQSPNDKYIIYAEVQIYVCIKGEYLNQHCILCSDGCRWYCDNHYGCNKPELYNVAMKEKAWAPHTVYGSAESTVDGRTNAINFQECMGAYSQSKGDKLPRFLWIDFSRFNWVYSVIIQTRLDCCAERMNNLYILAFGYSGHNVSLGEQRDHRPQDICFHTNQPFIVGEAKNFTCNKSPMLAYRVALQAIHPSWLLVCEVTVMGHPAQVLTAGQAGCSKTYWNCENGLVCENDVCKIKPENCSGNEDHCVSPTACSVNATTKLCLLKAGESCQGNNSVMCVNGTVCDTGDVCRIKIGGACGSSNKTHCQYHSQCQGSVCRLVHGANCTSNNDCVSGLICDLLRQCRIPKNESCKDRPHGCLTGGRCDKNDVCTCSSVSTKSNTSYCEPASSSVCPVHDANNRSTVTCKCNSGYSVDRTSYSCKLGPGAKCDITEQCGSDMICGSTKICEIIPGESCSEHEYSCTAGTLCDEDKMCRWKENAQCTFFFPSLCRLGHVCDVNSRCKIPAGAPCYIDEMCEAGSRCVNFKCKCSSGVSVLSPEGDRCVPENGTTLGPCRKVGDKKCQDPNAECNADKCQCRKGYRVRDNLSCGKGLGQICKQDVECVTGMHCDSSEQCRLLLGQPCDHLGGQCSTRAVCDKNSQCKLDLYANCSGVNIVNCKFGTSCDSQSRCQLLADSSCDSTDSCSAGAVCQDKLCRCDKDNAVKKNFICQPVAGKVTSACDPIREPCTVPNAVCVNGTCRCRTGTETTKNFGCVVKSGGEVGEIESFPLTIILGLSACLVVAALVVILSLFLWRKQRSKNLADAQAATRTAPFSSQLPESAGQEQDNLPVSSSKENDSQTVSLSSTGTTELVQSKETKMSDSE